MRARRGVAAATGVAGAVLAHGLDVAGLLPFVHEAATVRYGLSPLITIAWLTLAATMGAMAARRPMTVGAAGAVAVAGLPELLARQDPGAMVERGALIGACMQWALLLFVIAVVVAVEARLFARPLVRSSVAAVHLDAASERHQLSPRHALRTSRPRAPPQLSFSYST